MVRKLVLFVILLIGGCSFSYGAQQIPMHSIDETPVGHSGPYAPARPWYITQDENVFTLAATPEDYTLVVLDEDDEVVYSDILLSGSTMFVLPSTLSGDFEIRLVPYDSTYYYRGYISL